MNIQDLVREKIIGNIKIGTKGEKGPKKLPYFNVEEDKATSKEMVDIFKQLYKENTTKLLIMFTSENPFDFKYKRYVNNKVVCVGNDTKAITIGKDNKGNNTQIEIDCNKDCQQRLSKKCKLVGSLRFVLVGIEADGVWKINTRGGLSLTNIATEIYKYKKVGKSIVNVPFELILTEQQSLAYGPYYSLELHGKDIKPQLTVGSPLELSIEKNAELETKQLTEGKTENKKTTKKANKEEMQEQESIEVEVKVPGINKSEELKNEKTKDNLSDYLVAKKFIPVLINGQNFDKIIFQDGNQQDVEYVLHPKANQDIIKYGVGTEIELISSTIEMDCNILCKYNLLRAVDASGNSIEFNNNEELKKAV